MSERDLDVDPDELAVILAARPAAIVPDGFHVRAADGMLRTRPTLAGSPAKRTTIKPTEPGPTCIRTLMPTKTQACGPHRLHFRAGPRRPPGLDRRSHPRPVAGGRDTTEAVFASPRRDAAPLVWRAGYERRSSACLRADTTGQPATLTGERFYRARRALSFPIRE